jgi:hypothetical protein
MEAWLELGLLIRVALATVSGAAIALTALAILRSPTAERGTAPRPPAQSSAGEPGVRLLASAPTNR